MGKIHGRQRLAVGFTISGELLQGSKPHGQARNGGKPNPQPKTVSEKGRLPVKALLGSPLMGVKIPRVGPFSGPNPLRKALSSRGLASRKEPLGPAKKTSGTGSFRASFREASV